MTEILHKTLPEDMRTGRGLPGVQPVNGDWMRVDEAYRAQMRHREALLTTRRTDVHWMSPLALGPAQELLGDVLQRLSAHGFSVFPDRVTCPDGRGVPLDRDAPLVTLGRLVQCDFCLLEKSGGEHVLQGAVLCFPARWRLSEKVGRPLTAIHAPVAEYDDRLARRVQRLFDGVQVGRPLWRFNRLWYADPELFQPRSATDPRPRPSQDMPYFRAERQTIFRLPQCQLVVFAIHSYVLRSEDVTLCD